MLTTATQTLGVQGAPSSKIMIVLDSISYQDLKEGTYLSGAAGNAFDRLISRAGLSRANVLITAVCNEVLPSGHINWLFNEKGIVREPMMYMGHYMRLHDQIETHQPNVIVAMGPYALHLLTGKGSWQKRKDKKTKEITGWTGLSDWRGSILDGISIADGRKVIAVQPIDAVNAQWKLHTLWTADMIRVAEQAQFPEIRRHHRQLHIDPPAHELESLVEELLESPDPISFDIEFYHGKLLCIGFCAYEGWALTVTHTGDSTMALYRRILESGHALCAQNAMFDCGVLEWHFNIKTFPHLTYDTILAAHAAYIELPKDLGTLCSIYTEEPCYWDKSDWGGLGTSWSFDSMLEYNCKDCWVTHMVRAGQLRDDLINPAVRAAFDFEMSLLQPLWDISNRGVAWSVAQVDRVRERATETLAESQQMLDILYPDFDGGLNVSSSKQVGMVLYDRLGVSEDFGKGFDKVTKTSKSRLTNDLVLASISTAPVHVQRKDVIGVVSLIRKARKQRSMIAKFCGDGTEGSGITIDDDGRFRSTYVPSGTDTGRLSAKMFFPTGRGANAQNQPRDKEVRECFIPDPGMVMAYNDLERAESFVVAKITGDRVMLDHHMPGKNAHRLLGSTLFNKAPEEIDSDEYYLSKKTRHAGNYMQGWQGFMNNVNKEAEKTGVVLTPRNAKRLLGTYHDMHVGLGRWWNAIKYKLRQDSTLVNLYGRPRVFYGRSEAELPAAVAYIPQSTVGDCMNYGIINLWNSGMAGGDTPRIQMLMQIHDALVYQFPYTTDAEMFSLLRDVREKMLIPTVNPLDGETFIINTLPAISHTSWGSCRELSAAELGIV